MVDVGYCYARQTKHVVNVRGVDCDKEAACHRVGDLA